VNRNDLRALADVRIEDAAALLKIERWAAAYYLAGYAIECGLKACVLRYVGESGVIFSDAKYLKELGGVWTHDLEKLLGLADLRPALGQKVKDSEKFNEFWGLVTGWTEVSRYETKTESEARGLFEAITDPAEGVLKWTRIHW
jgi:HEPN domain-containing protein